MSAGRDWIARHLADVPPDLLDTKLRAIPDDARLEADEEVVRSMLTVSAP